MGAGILMSTQYGAKKYEQLERQISTNHAGRTGFFGGDRGTADRFLISAAEASAGAGRHYPFGGNVPADRLCGSDLYLYL